MKPWYQSRTIKVLTLFLLIWIGSWAMGKSEGIATIVGAVESLVLLWLRLETSEPLAKGKGSEPPS